MKYVYVVCLGEEVPIQAFTDEDAAKAVCDTMSKYHATYRQIPLFESKVSSSVLYYPPGERSAAEDVKSGLFIDENGQLCHDGVYREISQVTPV